MLKVELQTRPKKKKPKTQTPTPPRKVFNKYSSNYQAIQKIPDGLKIKCKFI